MDINEQDAVNRYNSTSSTAVMSYGGDGELLKTVAEYGNSKGIIPIRNYGRCKKHEGIISFEDPSVLKRSLKYTKHRFIDYEFNGKRILEQKFLPISEVVMKDADPTEALRFTVHVNGKTYMKQCIADGIIYATSLGSHGYFKSVSRMILLHDDQCGLSFIAPTYGICNLALMSIDKVEIVLERSAKIYLTGDKTAVTVDAAAGDILKLGLSCDGVALYGYDIFCCPECRKLRNSTLVNDQYLA